MYLAAEARLERLITARDWVIRSDNPARITVTDALATLARLGHDDVSDKLNAYADAAHHLARCEVPDLFTRDSVESLAEGVIAYQFLGDAILSGLRRLAQESETATPWLPMGSASPSGPACASQWSMIGTDGAPLGLVMAGGCAPVPIVRERREPGRLRWRGCGAGCTSAIDRSSRSRSRVPG